jgi:cyclase
MNGRLVKTQKFGGWRDVGDPVKSSAVYNSQYADELIFLNISRNNRSIEQIADLIKAVSKVCFMPLSVGGGVDSVKSAAYLIENGADKVIINSATYEDYSLIKKISDRFGSQAIVICIDIKRNGDKLNLVSNCGIRVEGINLKNHMKICEESGAGEFLIQSVDRDGLMNGYDIDLLKTACANSRLPIIGCGGAGDFNHLKDAFLEADVNALACGSLFNFSDSNPMRAKAYLTNYGLSFKVV